MDGAMLSKSLTQFFVDGWGCVPSLLFTWGQTMVEVVKIMVTPTPRAALYPGRAVRVLSRAITSQASVLGNIPVSLCIYDHLS